jgi:hypothetical protein
MLSRDGRGVGYSTSRWFALAITALFAACEPVPGTDGDDTDGDGVTDPDLLTASGRLYAEPMSLTWGWNSSESVDGICMDLKIATNGADVLSWQLDVVADQAVDEIYFVSGAQVRPTAEGFTVSPSVEPGLEDGEEVLARFCSRPGVRPESMTATVEYVEPIDTDPPDVPDPYGALLDPAEEFLLNYAMDGEENGGRCMRMRVSNVTSVPMIDWSIEVTMAAIVTPTASSGLLFHQEDTTSDRLVIVPDFDSRTIQPFDFEEGRVCLKPFAEPIGIRSGEPPTP